MEGPEITFAEATIDNGSFGTRTVRFETGRLAKQAGGSVLCYLDDETTLLSTTAAGKQPKDQFDFFPLTVDVEERMYAAGKIPGSFFRREGRPSTDAILTCRLIDRPLRPTFKKGLRNEVQVVITVLSLNPDHQYDVLAINGASASTQISGLPFSGPVGATRVALIDGQWVAFPNFSDAQRSTFDMVVAGRVAGDDVAIMMVEAESTEATWDLVKNQGKTAPTEEIVAEGLEAAKKFIRVLCDAQSELASQAAKPVQDFPIFLDYQDDVYEAVEKDASEQVAAAFTIVDKQDREDKIEELKGALKAELAGEGKRFEGREKEVSAAYRALQKAQVRQRILRDKVRIDGRGLADIRALSAEVEVLPRVHGSAIFERGETQIMGVTTLNMLRMEQQLDTLGPLSRKRYMHNYNFPPYSTGETGRVGSPKRREIGHGALAERALMPVLPTREEFPYAIRQVSEALSSNGSTSMGSVCASTLALLNAGVPLRAPVAGIAMGLVSAEVDGQTQYAALTDILGAEDAFGDMDFKVAGTREFVTAIQLDTKLDGIPADVLARALTQARDARLYILDVMHEAIDGPDEMSPFAPRVITVKVPVDKIGEVIGPKGKMINQIQEDTGADLSIEDDGTVYIGATDGASAEAARAAVNAIANPQMPEIGERFLGTVVKTTTFGAFVSLLPGKDGLLHISEVRKLVGGKRIDNVEDVLKIGQKVQVELKEVDPRGKLSLAVVEDASAAAEAAPEPRRSRPPWPTPLRSAPFPRPQLTTPRPSRPRTTVRRRAPDPRTPTVARVKVANAVLATAVVAVAAVATAVADRAARTSRTSPPARRRRTPDPHHVVPGRPVPPNGGAGRPCVDLLIVCVGRCPNGAAGTRSADAHVRHLPPTTEFRGESVRRHVLTVIAVPALVLAVAGCGGGSSASDATSPSTSASSTSSAAPTTTSSSTATTASSSAITPSSTASTTASSSAAAAGPAPAGAVIRAGAASRFPAAVAGGWTKSAGSGPATIYTTSSGGSINLSFLSGSSYDGVASNVTQQKTKAGTGVCGSTSVASNLACYVKAADGVLNVNSDASDTPLPALSAFVNEFTKVLGTS